MEIIYYISTYINSTKKFIEVGLCNFSWASHWSLWWWLWLVKLKRVQFNQSDGWSNCWFSSILWLLPKYLYLHAGLLSRLGSIDLKFVMSDKFLSFYGFERFRFEVNIIPCNTFHENILIVYLNDGIFFLITNYYICKTKLKTKE